jgi:Flp pilus assembly pilin Flp
MRLITFLRALRSDASGQDLLEYALLVALIAFVCYGAIELAGTNINTLFKAVADKVGEAAGTGA